MRSPLIAAWLLTVGMYAPAAGIRHQFPPTLVQAEAIPSQPPADRRGTSTVIGDGAVGRARAASQQASLSLVPRMRRAQPGNQPADRKLPGPVGLLLALALVDSEGTPPRTSPPREIQWLP
jgi:hypothetical protein